MNNLNLKPSDDEIDEFIRQSEQRLANNYPDPLEPYAEQDGNMNSEALLEYIDSKIIELVNVKSFGSGNGRVINIMQKELLQSIREDIFGERLEV